ncbi:MAG: DDE-type integrase/transposase/recombinase [Myxococcales bacterium]|nr:DDE-type integrase/transposase/recombinase [Myxococcales bacterium]
MLSRAILSRRQHRTSARGFKSALYTRGLCECLYVDNGSNYSSLEMSQVCQRIGAILCHTPVRDGAAKGKIERFFRTVRMSFLSRQLDLSSLDALNRAFTAWVEDEYHQSEHSSSACAPSIASDSISAASASCRRATSTTSCSSSSKIAPSLPTTPSPSRTPASKRRATSEVARSRSASIACTSTAPSCTSKVSAWARHAPSTSSPMTESPRKQLTRTRRRATKPARCSVIRAHFGLAKDPFSAESLTLLPHQREVLDTLRVHCQQGGLCVIVGEPGTGKSVIKHALCQHDPKRLMTPVVNRTLHTYHSTLRILCEAFQIEPDGADFRCEKRLIEEARRLNASGKCSRPSSTTRT